MGVILWDLLGRSRRSNNLAEFRTFWANDPKMANYNFYQVESSQWNRGKVIKGIQPPTFIPVSGFFVNFVPEVPE